MAKKVADLKVALAAETSKFKKGFADANRTLSGFERRLKGIGKLAKGAFAVGGGVLFARELNQAARSAVAYGDSIAKAAKTANIGATSLQTLRRAAVLAGQSQQGLDDAVARFNRRLGEARRGNAEYAKTFRQLGVTALDTTENALDKVLDRLAGIKDQSVRTSFATKVFGDDARRMALIVGDGAKALRKVREETKRLGFVLDESAIKKAAAANNKLSDLDLTLKNRLAGTVLDNIDGFVSFKTALNDIELAAVNAAAAFGNFIKETQAKGLEDRIAGRLFKNNERIAELQGLLNAAARDPLKGAGGPDQGKLRQEISRLQSENAALRSRTAAAAKFDAAFAEKFPGFPTSTAQLEGPLKGGKPSSVVSATGGIPGAKFSAGFSPGVPSLKFDAMTKEAKKAGEAIADVMRRAQTPMQNLKAELAAVQKLMSFTENTKEIAALEFEAGRLKDAMRDLKDSTNEWKLAGIEAGRAYSDAFAGAIVFGDRLGVTLKRLSQQLASRALSNILFKGLSSLPGVGGLFGGFRAAGGPVTSGRSYIVGERGPELFTPGAAGFVTPNGASGRGNVVVNQTLRFDVGLESVQDQIAMMTPRIAAGVTQAINKQARRPSHA